jgi:hypothetical protein
MTEHPITPPPELVAKLWREASEGRFDLHHPAPIGEIFNHGVYLAYAAGADHQLKACGKALDDIPGGWGDSRHLLHVCRPKPPSLKERLSKAIIDGDEREALKLLEELDDSL